MWQNQFDFTMIVKKSDIAWNQLPAIMLAEYIQPESSYISILSLYFGSCEVWSLFNAIDIDFFSLPAIWDPRLNKIYGWTKIHFEKMYILFEFSWPLTTYPKHLCNQKLGHWNSWSRCFFHSLSCCILNLFRHTTKMSSSLSHSCSEFTWTGQKFTFTHK